MREQGTEATPSEGGARSRIVPVGSESRVNDVAPASGVAAPLVPEARPSEASGPVDVSSEPTPRVRARGAAKLSIGLKLSLLISGLQLAIVTGLATYFHHQTVGALRTELHSKADTYAQLVSAQVRSAVAFGDKETAREVFDSIAKDGDVMAAVLFDSAGRALHAWGTPGTVAASASAGVLERKVFELPDRFLSVAPVISLEGPRGTLALEFSKGRLLESRQRAEQAALLVGGVAIVVGAALALIIAHSLARRLRAISLVAEKVAGGDLSQTPPSDASRDEIGSLARSFASMLGQIQRLFAERAAAAAEEQTRLEGLVQKRTQMLEQRNDDMRRVLDNVDQGFLTIDARGTMSSERSAILERWLGKAPASGNLWEYIGQRSPALRQQLELGWEEVVSGCLPREVSLDQMPRRFSHGDEHFCIEYKPIGSIDGEIDRTLIVLSDITPLVARERAEAEQRDAVRLFTRLNEDRAGVLGFVAEAQRIVSELTSGAPPAPQVTKRLLHTLKGNASVFGIERLSRVCHQIEDALAESAGNMGAPEVEQLRATWKDVHAQLVQLIGEETQHTLTIGDDEYAALLRALERGRPLHELRAMVEAWALEATEVRLRRAARQAAALAERMGKGPIDVCVESNGVRLDAEIWNEVWTEFPHLIRNAIDHGFDMPEGQACGEQPKGKLWLRTFVQDSSFIIEVEDSGKGVDWERVRAAAKKRGLPHRTQRDLEQALFADGLSTKDQVGETSGRGVGMAAVAAAVQKHGGQILVTSKEQQGTRVRMSWPASTTALRSTPVPGAPSRAQ